ncbi:MAG: right-handed parallel beta-helix repeat-containing protein, partial [Gemmataceae bacterium]|nr:right-handed parallel beta-helix repeat-containing protein [Gemmataceae bacterium]
MSRWFNTKLLRRRTETRRARFSLTNLETRLAPAVIGVTNTNDSGAGSLRQAIIDASMPDKPGMDQITFDPLVVGTITLATPLNITSDLTIVGPGADKLAVSGNKLIRVFEVSDGSINAISATISGLTIRDGLAAGGAGVNVGQSDALVLTACHVTGNSVTGAGAGISVAAGGDLTVLGSTFSANVAATGGAVYFSGAAGGGSIEFRNTTISGNSAGTGGGIALANFTGDVALLNSTILQNKATSGPGGGIVRMSGTGSVSMLSTIVQGNTTSAPSGSDISTTGTV